MAAARPNLNNVLVQIKQEYEQAITTRGRNGTTSLIRSQQLINHIHEFVKEELVFNGINRSKIYPPLGRPNPEMKLSGFLKGKKQDITVLPNNPTSELINVGLLEGKTDSIGRTNSENAISINVRSQLSSITKNFDTLFERTFAEPLNLHLRLPNLVMGELYMVPTIAYDPDQILHNIIRFREELPSFYIQAFSFLNGRIESNRDHYKYERLCLLIVDFSQNPPELITTHDQLIEQGIITEAQRNNISVDFLNPLTFVSDLIAIYTTRHGNITPLT